jgi:hypothetical protein
MIHALMKMTTEFNRLKELQTTIHGGTVARPHCHIEEEPLR